MEQICFNVGAGVLAIAGSVVGVASFVANILPNGNQTTNKVWGLIIKAVNYIALNINVDTTKK